MHECSDMNMSTLADSIPTGVGPAAKLALLKQQLASKEAELETMIPEADATLKKLQEDNIRIQAELSKAQSHRNSIARNKAFEIKKVKKQLEDEAGSMSTTV